MRDTNIKSDYLMLFTQVVAPGPTPHDHNILSNIKCKLQVKANA